MGTIEILVNVGGILVKSPMKVESLFHIRVEKSDLVEKNQISLDLGPQNQDKSEKSGVGHPVSDWSTGD